MATWVSSLDARCPLYGTTVLSVGKGGRVQAADDLHAIPLHPLRRFGEGITLCDDCGTLAELPEDSPIN